MEWVEVTAGTVDEAKDRALDQLGVDESDAEFEILEEPRPGLFGRMRGEARVRARVRPTTPRPKAERRDRRKPGTKADKADKVDKTDKPEKAEKAEKTAKRPVKAAAAATAASSTASTSESVDADEATPTPARAKAPAKAKATKASRPVDVPVLEDTEMTSIDQPEATDPAQLGEAVSTFLDGLVGAFGATGTTKVDVVDGDLDARVDGSDLGLMIGPQGNTLQAIQELTRLATQRSTSDRSVRIRIDIGQYRERRRDALIRFTAQVAEQVISSGAPRSLEPMSAADRKVVHDAAQLIDGVTTGSEGEEPRRRVVIKPCVTALADQDRQALRAILTERQGWGILGPGSIDGHIDHALRFVDRLPAAPFRGADLGSGAGLPGLVLALACPSSQWLLIDNRHKRADALRMAVRSLGLEDRVAISSANAQVVAHESTHRGSFDVVVARSFGKPAIAAECAAGLLRVGGVLLVSEPPEGSVTLAERWPADPLADLGFGPAVVVDQVAATTLVTAPPDSVPRLRMEPARF